MKTKYIAISLAFLVLGLCFVGCGPRGPKRVQISGKVTFDGEPIEKGTIRFEATEADGVSDGGKIVDGAYTVEVTTGAKKVSVKGTKVVGQREADPQLNPGVMVDDLKDLPIPRDLTKEVTVEKKGQTFDFDFTTEEIEEAKANRNR